MENTQSKHVHAELMAQYAEDAMKTDKPWKLWEFKKSTEHSWSECSHSPEWCELNNYRRKPKYININGYNVPEPLREEPEMHTNYFVVSTYECTPEEFAWDGYSIEKQKLKAGIIHLTKENAQIHLDALLSFTRSN